MKKTLTFCSAFLFAASVLFPLVSQAQVTFVSPANPANPMSPCKAAIQKGLSYGMTDSSAAVTSAGGTGAVTDLQLFLNSNGYLKVTPTGYFGSLTLAAVKEFQAENGVPATGYVGPLTAAAAEKYSCVGNSLSSGGSPGQQGIITVLAPVASSTLIQGSYENIVWTQSQPQVAAGAPVPANQGVYDISLMPLPPQCSGGQVCPMYMLAPSIIADNVSAHGNYQIGWPWTVATSTPGGPAILSGQYKIEVCDSVIPVVGSQASSCADSGTFSIVAATTTVQ